MPSFAVIVEQSQGDFKKVIDSLTIKDDKEPQEYLAEYKGKRERRDKSIGKREDKRISDGKGGTKIVKVARLTYAFPKKIVRIGLAFLFGGKMTIKGSESDDALNSFKNTSVKDLKLKSTLKRFARTVMIETKAALLFYPVISQKKLLGIPLSKSARLRVKLLDQKSGEFYPHFDDFGDMDAFMWAYEAIAEDGKKHKHVKIFTAENIITAIEYSGAWQQTSDTNLFKKIPIVYADQDAPEWEDITTLMDEYETRVSRLADTNDYFSEPMILLYGDPENAPDKGQVGKMLKFDSIEDDNGKKTYGDAKYLTWDHEPAAIKLELETLWEGIHSMSSTPDISFDNVKGVGSISGVALELMFMDAVLKASDNMERFEESVQRCVSVIKSGIGNITETKLSSKLEENEIEVSFGSVLPSDLKEAIEIIMTATGDKPIMSQEEGVLQNPMIQDAAEELKRIQTEDATEAQRNNVIVNSVQ